MTIIFRDFPLLAVDLCDLSRAEKYNKSSMASEQKARMLNGKAVAAEVRKEAAAELAQLKQTYPRFQPGLTIVQVNFHDDVMTRILYSGFIEVVT